MNRAEILEEAKKCVCGQREQDYGTPENNFETIGLLWGVYLRAAHPELSKELPINGITAKDVAIMMSQLKVARIATGSSPDSFVDSCRVCCLCWRDSYTDEMTQHQYVFYHKSNSCYKEIEMEEKFKKADTLCWSCGKINCSWMESLVPIPGWDAEPKPYKSGGITYHVRYCPEFRPMSAEDKKITHPQGAERLMQEVLRLRTKEYISARLWYNRAKTDECRRELKAARNWFFNSNLAKCYDINMRQYLRKIDEMIGDCTSWKEIKKIKQPKAAPKRKKYHRKAK